MVKLSKSGYQKAADFLKTEARAIDRTRFGVHFENGEPESVVAALEQYQNYNGGLGHGLEPDVQAEVSSALATAIGLGMLADAGIDKKEPIVRQTVGYLLDTYDEEKNGWWIVPDEVTEAPRAVWWNSNEGWPWGNPTAEIIGLLQHYESLVPGDFLGGLKSYAISYINGLSDYDSHELQSIIRLSEQLPEEEVQQITGKTREMAAACVTTDPAEWKNYTLQPLQIVKSPESPYYDLFSEVIEVNLDFLVQNQTDGGYWEPSWSWGQYEDDWPAARHQWRGSLTVDALKVLKNFNHIE